MKLTEAQKAKHTHIWKYIGAGYERICESPFPFGEQGCGKTEIKHTNECCPGRAGWGN